MDENLQKRSEQLIEAARLERDLASEALKTGDLELCWTRLYHVLTRLSPYLVVQECGVLFATTSLEFSNLCFFLGKGFNELMTFLQTGRTAAEHLGDRRSRALIHLHLGRLYAFAGKLSKAMDVFAQGRAETEELGDEDILTQAAELIGMYYFLQGRFAEARPHFERAAQSYESSELGRIVNPSGPMMLSFFATCLGQFNNAIGTANYYHRLALERPDQTSATTLRAVLGVILLMIKKKDEAAFHLSEALREAIKTKNILAGYFAKGGIAYHHFLEGRLDEAREGLAQVEAEGTGSGLLIHYGSFLFFEMIYEFHRLDIEPIPGLEFHRQIQRIMREPNIHLRGVALRLKAMEAAESGEDRRTIESDLKQSEEYLIHSGDPIQLAKTRQEMARFKLRDGDQEAARVLAQKAWKGFSGYGDIFYTDDLRHLLAIEGDFSPDHDTQEKFFDLFIDMIQELTPSPDLNRLLTQTVAATNRFFGAERGGIFWFSDSGARKGPELRASCNLIPSEVASENFRTNLALVFKACKENRSLIVRHKGEGLWPNQDKAVLCVPFEFEGRVQGVLYHDNSFTKDCFDYFDKSHLVRMANSLTVYIERLIRFSRSIEQKASVSLTQLEQNTAKEIVTQSPVMNETLAKADRIAASDSTVLILGETGVGKELLAQRIHMMSQRSEKPFVIVDPTTIPENLVESELFGHEKGAFTGADRQKRGRLELAHSGTLFIDEVGEIPKSIQVKLLRVIQERTFVRVGGNRTLHPDFRLIVATSRDLASEVAAGRFREDLYYRLNVVPLTLPPLRERKEDIPLLAGYFLDRYASKYNRAEVRLRPQDKDRLKGYNWPGNVRELENVMERTVLLSTDERLEFKLPTEGKTVPGQFFSDYPTLDEIQRRYIRHVLKKTGGKVGGPAGAAEILGMKRTSLNNRMKRLGLR